MCVVSIDEFVLRADLHGLMLVFLRGERLDLVLRVGESNTIGFENGIRWLTCVQGAPVPHGVTGAEMIERGKPGAMWPTRWMAPNKNKKETAHPSSTWALVPAATTQDGDGRNQIQRRCF